MINKRYSVEDIASCVFVIFGSIMIFGLFASSCSQISACNQSCKPDLVQAESCYYDRVICVGKDKVFVKMIKE